VTYQALLLQLNANYTIIYKEKHVMYFVLDMDVVVSVLSAHRSCKIAMSRGSIDSIIFFSTLLIPQDKLYCSSIDGH